MYLIPGEITSLFSFATPGANYLCVLALSVVLHVVFYLLILILFTYDDVAALSPSDAVTLKSM